MGENSNSNNSNNSKLDVQSLISSAAQGEPQGEPTVANPQEPQIDDNAQLVHELVGLLQQDPELANKIADVLEQHFGGGEQMNNQQDLPVQSAAPAQAPPMQAGPAPEVQPSLVQSPPVQASSVPPEVMQEVAALKQALAPLQAIAQDYQADREASRLRQRYDQLRQHYGDLLPQDIAELSQPLSDKYNAIVNGQVSPYELALLLAASDKLHGGDAPLKDRLLASVAQQGTNAPPVEGIRGVAPSTEQKRPIPRTTAERMEQLKQMWSTLMQQQPGT